ncbi:MAG: septal ring lytic transglycosylase RlpA family protein [Methylocystis sp.]
MNLKTLTLVGALCCAFAASARAADGFTALASYYGGGPRKYEPNAHTANGELFDKRRLTAAHRTLPFGTRLLVSRGARSVVVRVNDRGPARWTGRDLDLSRGAAAGLAMLRMGVARVRVAVLR